MRDYYQQQAEAQRKYLSEVLRKIWESAQRDVERQVYRKGLLEMIEEEKENITQWQASVVNAGPTRAELDQAADELPL